MRGKRGERRGKGDREGREGREVRERELERSETAFYSKEWGRMHLYDAALKVAC